MFNIMENIVGGVVGLIGSFIQKKKMVGLYSPAQMQVLQELEDHYMREEMGLVGPSGSSSSWSPQAVTAKVGINKLGTPYFESLERRLEIDEEEFFTKDEFDL